MLQRDTINSIGLFPKGLLSLGEFHLSLLLAQLLKSKHLFTQLVNLFCLLDFHLGHGHDVRLYKVIIESLVSICNLLVMVLDALVTGSLDLRCSLKDAHVLLVITLQSLLLKLNLLIDLLLNRVHMLVTLHSVFLLLVLMSEEIGILLQLHPYRIVLLHAKLVEVSLLTKG